jgi:hypothetical protein
MCAVETELNTPQPVTLFTCSALRLNIQINMQSSLRHLGLECHQATPNLEAITAFLSRRYRYKDDDIPHEDIFQSAQL